MAACQQYILVAIAHRRSWVVMVNFTIVTGFSNGNRLYLYHVFMDVDEEYLRYYLHARSIALSLVYCYVSSFGIVLHTIEPREWANIVLSLSNPRIL